MPKAAQLSNDEVTLIWSLKAKGNTVKEIARYVGRSVCSVYRVLAKTSPYKAKSRSGRPRITTVRQDRNIRRMASCENLSSRGIARASGVKISKNTVLRRIRETGRMVYRKMARYPLLKLTHKQRRLQWAKNFMAYGDKWMHVIFSDEKKWNLDGPDGWACYWHDLRKDRRSLFSRQQGGQSLMVWAGFCYNGQVGLKFLSGTQKSEHYQDTLRTHLLPVGELLGGPKWIFQHDNASIHGSSSTKTFLSCNNVSVMDWPALSPDLNPIENVWGILTRQVFQNGTQYFVLNDLKKAIEKAWYNLDVKLLQHLVLSMENRVFEVIRKNGNCINY